MAITLEQFKELNLQPGDPVEVDGEMLYYFRKYEEFPAGHRLSLAKKKDTNLAVEVDWHFLENLKSLKLMNYKS